jgi:hypothetical protein
VVLTIGGQCDEKSYLSRVDVAVTGVVPRQKLTRVRPQRC